MGTRFRAYDIMLVTSEDHGPKLLCENIKAVYRTQQESISEKIQGFKTFNENGATANTTLLIVLFQS